MLLMNCSDMSLAFWNTDTYSFIIFIEECPYGLNNRHADAKFEIL